MEADKSESPLVYIIVLNWNGWEDTAECLESLKRQTYKNSEILVVDNASTDNSVNEINKRFPEIRVHQSSENRGYAAGNNLGIKIAMKEGAEYVWILNNDTIADANALEKLVQRMNSDPETGLCGVTLAYSDRRDIVQAMGGGIYTKWSGTTQNLGDGLSLSEINEKGDVEEKLDFIAGASIMASRRFIEEVGFMNEEYFLYYEEIDWAVRSGKQFKLGYSPESIVYHKEGSSTKADRQKPNNRSISADYYQLRNRLKFTLKYYPARFPTVYLTVWAALIRRLLRGKWDRLPMILTILVGYTPERFKG